MVSPPGSAPCGKEIMIVNRSNRDAFFKELEKLFKKSMFSQAHNSPCRACGVDVKEHPVIVGFLNTFVKTQCEQS